MLACHAMKLMVAMMSFLPCHLAVFPAPDAALRVAALLVAALRVAALLVAALLVAALLVAALLVAALLVAALLVAALLVARWPVGPLLPHLRPHLRTGGVADPLPLFARAVKPLRVRERENERVIVRAWV